MADVQDEAEITDETPFPHNTAVAAEFASDSPLDPVKDIGVPLWANVVTVTSTTTDEAENPTVSETRYVVATRERLDLESPTELRNVFDVAQEGTVHRVVEVLERQAVFQQSDLQEFHNYTRGLDKTYAGGPQAENASKLDAVPLQRLVIPLTRATKAIDGMDVDGDEEIEEVLRELGESRDEDAPDSSVGVDAMGRWIVAHVDRPAMDAMLGSGRTEGSTVDVRATLGLVLQGMNRWWTFVLFFQQIIQNLYMSFCMMDYMEIPTGGDSGRPGAIGRLAFVGDRYLEFLARIGACRDMIPRPQWSRHRFDEVTNETKTNLSMYIPMIEAGMHQHLQLAPYDPQRVLPNPPAELQHLGMSAPIEPIYKVVADLAEAILGFLMLWVQYLTFQQTVPLLRRLGVAMHTLPTPMRDNIRVAPPVTRRTRGILRTGQEMTAFQARLEYTWNSSNLFDLLLEGLGENGRINTQRLRPEQVKYWWIMQKIGITILENCIVKQFVSRAPPNFNEGNYTRLLQQTFRRAEWVGPAVSDSDIMRFVEQKWRDMGWTVTASPALLSKHAQLTPSTVRMRQNELRMKFVELLIGAVVLDQHFVYDAKAWGVYDRLFRQAVIGHMATL